MNRILPYILATLTQRNRHKVENIQWGKEWTYNLFRLWEIVFWRRCASQDPTDTIRAESSAVSWFEGDTQFILRRFFTWEAVIVHAEGAIRSFFKKPEWSFKFVPIPVLVTPEGVVMQRPIFSFAIATLTNANVSYQASVSNLAINCTGSNVILFSGVSTINSNVLTAATYAGSNMTLSSGGDRWDGRWQYLYYKIAPATGSNNIAMTTSSGDIALTGSCYSGCSQGALDTTPAFNPHTVGTSSPATQAFTTVADNCWLIMTSGDATGSDTAGANTTLRTAAGGFPGQLFDSNGAKSPAGSYSLNENFSGTQKWATAGASFAPVAATVNANFLMFM